MVWIVCVWHLQGYISAVHLEGSYLARLITGICLASFFFFSGFLLAPKFDDGDRLSQTKTFFKSRLLRILPLFTLACLSFPNFNFSFGDRILNIIGLSAFVSNHQMPTIWFVSMLCFFYFLLPIFAKRKFFIQIIILLFIIIIISLFDIYKVLESEGGVDKRIYIYLPCFVFGSILCSKGTIAWWHYAIAGTLLVGLAYIKQKYCLNSVFSILVTIVLDLSGVLLVYASGKLVERIIESRVYFIKGIGFLSYVSFCAYLFHRHIFTFFELCYLPQSVYLRVLFLYCICVPLVLVASFIIQKGYDIIVKKLILSPENKAKGNI